VGEEEEMVEAPSNGAWAAAAPVCLQPLKVPAHTAFVEVTGSLLFGAGDMLEQVWRPPANFRPLPCSLWRVL
jgi:hypothetical protein